MADRYWVGGTGNWTDSTNHWATSSGGSPSIGNLPTSSDNAIFDSLSNASGYTVTVNSTVSCNDLTIGTPASGVTTFTISSGSGTINMAGSFNMASTTNTTGGGLINFIATSGIKTLTSNGAIARYAIRFAGSGATFQLADNFNTTISFTLQNGSFDPNGKTVTHSSISNATPIVGAFTFYNLTLIGSSNIVAQCGFTNNITVTNTFTASSFSSTTRMLISSDVLGTTRTITASTISMSNVDFQDITGAGSGTWSGTSIGDCGGNSGITFTTPTTQHWINVNGGSWSTLGNWTSRVPLPQDDVIMDCAFGTSKTVTSDMPRLGKSIDWTGATWTTALTWAMNVTTSMYGSLTMITGLTYSGTSGLTFAGRSSYTLRSYEVVFSASTTLNAFGGTLQLLDDYYATGTNGALTITVGTFNANNKNINTYKFVNGSGGTTQMGTGLWTINGVGTTTWNVTGGTITTNSSSVIKFTDTSNSALTFVGGGKIYNDIWFSRGASTGEIAIAGGAHTFTDLKDTGSEAHILRFPNSQQTKVTTFTISGSASDKKISLRNTSGTTHATLTKLGGGKISRGYLDVDYLTGSPVDTWFMGATSIDGGHNTNIYFVDAPAVTEVTPSVLAGLFSSITPVIQIETLKNNLSAYYKMEGNSNDSVGSKNGTDAFITYSLANGKILQGAGFDGLTSKITLPNTAKGGNSFAISFHVYLNSMNSVTLYSESADKNANIEVLANGVLRFHIKTSTAAYQTVDSVPGTIVLGRFNHTVRSYDNITGYLKGYVNDVEVISQYVGGNQTYTSGTNENILGCYRIGGVDSGFIDGKMDEVAIYSRSLTFPEVSLLYNTDTGLTYPFTTIYVATNVLTATFVSNGFIYIFGQGVTDMYSKTDKYLLGMEDIGIL